MKAQPSGAGGASGVQKKEDDADKDLQELRKAAAQWSIEKLNKFLGEMATRSTTAQCEKITIDNQISFLKKIPKPLCKLIQEFKDVNVNDKKNISKMCGNIVKGAEVAVQVVLKAYMNAGYKMEAGKLSKKSSENAAGEKAGSWVVFAVTSSSSSKIQEEFWLGAGSACNATYYDNSNNICYVSV